MASRSITVAGFTFELGPKLEEFGGGELYGLRRDPDLAVTLVPTALVDERYLRFLDKENQRALMARNQLSYVPFPMVYAWDKIGSNGQTAIVSYNIGKASSGFTYSQDQLKYLAYQVTKALKLIHGEGYVQLRCFTGDHSMFIEGTTGLLGWLSTFHWRYSNGRPQKYDIL